MKAAPYWDTYGSQLACLNYGRATWEADPKANGEDYAVQVGDVGYMRNGGFHRLFNILQSQEHPWNQSLGVPEGFDPLKTTGKVVFARSPLKAGPLHSHSVRHISASGQITSPTGSPVSPSGNFSFACSRELGAALVLLDQAYRSDVLSTELFEEYFLANYESWLAFARHLKRGISLDDLILVTGRDVTRGWAMAVFSQAETKGKGGIGIDTALGVSATFGMEFGWKTEGIVHSHSGPQPVEPPSPNGKGKALDIPLQHKSWDQCVFLRGYCLRRRNILAPRRLKAAAGPSDLGSGDRAPLGMLMTLSGESVHSQSADYNPLSPILDYILENSEVEVALAHDDDLYSFVRDTSEPDEVRRAIEANAPKIIIVGATGRIDRSVTSPSKHKSQDPVEESAHAYSNIEATPGEEPPRSSRVRIYREGEEDDLYGDSYEFRKDIIKKKIRAIARMSRMLAVLREESERVSEIKSMRDGRLPCGLLILGPADLRDIPPELLTPNSPTGSTAWRDPWFAEDRSLLSVPTRTRSISQSSEMSQVPPPYSPSSPSESRVVTNTSEHQAESRSQSDPSNLLGTPSGKWHSVKAKISAIGRLQRNLAKIRETSAGRLRGTNTRTSTPSLLNDRGASISASASIHGG
ncbi:hypothetical protein OE88DRAFT_456372 [Heliocybe sulcata]|uniref:Uncharacterized protein n=1 Tax=Heliocybe sulcata TaxID=5364 RepID=A0A5C3MVB0_9AGAM|nr:hypothetical protein OE88DRAFT_456372 [Heliocybe sulcata]